MITLDNNRALVNYLILTIGNNSCIVPALKKFNKL